MGKSLEELIKIEKQLKDEKKRVELSLKLGFCPECGSEIINENLEIIGEPYKNWLGILKQKTRLWDERKFCSKDKSHYEVKIDWEDVFMRNHG